MQKTAICSPFFPFESFPFLVVSSDRPADADLPAFAARPASSGNRPAVGSCRYKLWFNTSPYHNLPVVNLTGQGAGKEYAAIDVQYQQNKKYSRLNMDIAKAYPAEAGIKSWLREVKMNKIKGIIEIKDQYIINKKPESLTQSFMTVCSTDITIPGKIIFTLPDQSRIYLDYDKKLWSASKEKMELTTPEDKGLKQSWDGKDIWRILLTGKSLNTHQSTVYKIYK